MRFMLFLLVLFSQAPAFSADHAVVSVKTIYPGQGIKTADLKLVLLTKEPTISYKFASEFYEVAGLVASRTILKGRFIPLTSVRSAPVVEAGDTMRVNFRHGALSISIICVALGNGGFGDNVKFRNPNSGKIMVGVVQRDGSVLVEKL